MNKQLIIIIALVAVALIGGGILMLSGDDSSETKSLGSFTKENVADHSTKDDCWTIISGNVYDITSYVPRHPGGDEILMACGTDGTSLFTSRETSTGKQVGTGDPHSSTAASQLADLQVGTLKSD